MNPGPGPDIDVNTLLAIRRETDAVRLITERLKVKEMGPADHIRTKHEVKAFVESGDITIAQQLLKHAGERRAENQSITTKMTQRHGERVTE